MWIKSGLVVGLMALFTAVGANASPIYESLTSTAAAGSPINTYTVADSFKASGPTLSEVEIALQKSSTAGGSGSVLITLNADNGLTGTTDGPGSVLYALATITDASLTLSNTKYIIDLNSMGIVNLHAGTTYWIEVAKNGTINTTQIKNYVTTIAPTIGSGDYSTKTGGAFTANVAPSEMALCISADNSCVADAGLTLSLSQSNPSVPEPATMAILGSSLVGLGWFRRRAATRSLKK